MWIITFIPLMALFSITATIWFGPLSKCTLYLRRILLAPHRPITLVSAKSYSATTVKVTSTNELRSPVTQSACLWWRVLVREKRPYQNGMVKVMDHSEALKIEVHDAETTFIVNLQQADIRVPKAIFLGTGGKIDKQYDAQSILANLRKNNWLMQRRQDNERTWIEEWVLRNDNPFTIYGESITGEGGSHFQATPKHPLIVTTFQKHQLIASLTGEAIGYTAILIVALAGIIYILRYLVRII